jgi:predicted choloylglycine hydrolase
LWFINLSGKSCFARGLTLGRMIRGVCMYNLSFLEQKLADNGLSIEDGLRMALENEKVIAEHFPELLEEIRGLAKGARLPYDYVLLETAFPFTVDSSSNCIIISALGTTTTDGAPLVGRNYDFLSDFKRCNQLRIVKRTTANSPS